MTALGTHTAPQTGAAGIHYRGLIWTLVRTDFKARYHGTLLGFAWALLKPLTMFLVLMVVFSFVFASESRYWINLIIGLFLWDFFVQSTSSGLVSLYVKSYLLSKVRFPAWIIVVTSIANALITLGVSCAVILVVLTVAGRAPTVLGLVLFAWYLLHFVVIVVGMSLASSVLFLRYRDLNQVWEVVLQAGFFLCPIVYPLSILPERFHQYLYLWPPTPIIQFTRAALVLNSPTTVTAHVCLTLEAVVVLAAGTWLFRRFSPRAAEYL